MDKRKRNGNGNGNGNGKSKHSQDNFSGPKALPIAAITAIDENELERRRKANIIVVDTNVLIEDPQSVHELRRGGNLLVIPWTCMIELNNLKNQPGIMFAVREVIREIRNLQRAKDPSLALEKEMLFANRRLNRQVPDDQILATMEFVIRQVPKRTSRYFGYSKVKMISNDNLVQVMAEITAEENPILTVEDYKKSRSRLGKKDLQTPILKIKAEEVSMKRDIIPVTNTWKTIPENGLVIGYTRKENKNRGEFVAIRRGEFFQRLENNISVSGISPKHNGGKNWEQIAALHVLTDPNIPCVIMQGGAGTGKTLLSLAAALEMRRKSNCRQVIVSRPVVPLDYEQQVGFLPGDIAQKLDPWLLPIRQNLEFIQDANGHEAYPSSSLELPTVDKKGKKAKETEAEKSAEKPLTALEFLRLHGINVQLLDSIRGSTFTDSIIIIDEAQNLSRHQARTIATRVGKGTKIIFLCDLSQIDNHHLDRNTSGAAHLIHKLFGHHLVAVVNLKETLRSEFASLAEKVL